MIGYAPLNITYFHVFVSHDVDHASTNRHKACLFFFFFSFERYDRYKDPKKYKSSHNFREKKKKKTAGFPFVCTCGSNTTLKYQIEIHKNERGIAVFRVRLFGLILRGGGTTSAARSTATLRVLTRTS